MITKTIGNTSLLHLPQEEGADIYIKLESKNPGGSVKDRPALFMIEDAINSGKLVPGKEIIEPSSGNMGIAISMIGATLGYRVHIVMPESMSLERRQILKAYGSNLILTDAKKGMRGTIEKTEEMLERNPNLVSLQQFDNPQNPLSHYKTTGPEILKEAQTLDVFVAGVGTGGTISGVGHYLKEQLPDVRIVALEPKESAVLSGGSASSHKIQGIGAGFIPKNYDADVVDEVLRISNDAAIEGARELAKKYGILAGISSGANYYGAKLIAKNLEKGQKVITLVCDTGERYFSTGIYE